MESWHVVKFDVGDYGVYDAHTHKQFPYREVISTHKTLNEAIAVAKALSALEN